jgi:hypothetical protein
MKMYDDGCDDCACVQQIKQHKRISIAQLVMIILKEAGPSSQRLLSSKGKISLSSLNSLD